MSRAPATCRYCSGPVHHSVCGLCGRPSASARVAGPVREATGHAVRRPARRAQVLPHPAALDRAAFRLPQPRPASPGEIVGTVVETRGPVAMRPRPNLWKGGTLVLLAIAIGPLFFMVWAALIALRLSLWMMGFRGLASGRGLLEGLLFHHFLGRLGRQQDTVPVYHHRVQCPGASNESVLVRQEGEFVDGCIMVGNTLNLRGQRRGGVFVLRGGFNETLGTRLSLRSNPWKVAALVVLMVLCLESLFGMALVGAQALG